MVDSFCTCHFSMKSGLRSPTVRSEGLAALRWGKACPARAALQMESHNRACLRGSPAKWNRINILLDADTLESTSGVAAHAPTHAAMCDVQYTHVSTGKVCPGAWPPCPSTITNTHVNCLVLWPGLIQYVKRCDWVCVLR